MVTKVVPGTLIASNTPEEVAKEAAARMARSIHEALKDRGHATVALSGGNTPNPAYAILAEETIDWNKVQIFWVDERCVPPESDRSNYGTAKKAFLDRIAIQPSNVHRMHGEDDPEKAAAEYEAMLRDTVKSKISGLPSMDLMVMGVGDDGHTASLFPGNNTHAITDRLVTVIPAATEPGREPREARLTLTVPILENAKNAVVICIGKAKHEPLERIWAAHGELNETPGRVIRDFRGSIVWIIDRAAGGIS